MTACMWQKSTQEFIMMNGASSNYFDPGDENQNSLYPPNTVPFDNQVAGHSFDDGKATLGMLKHKDGLVLKPIEKPIHGEKELKFYTELQKAVDPESLILKRFVPGFHGATVLKVHGRDVRFLVLQDVTYGFAEPCIIDIKIGRQTWDPDASCEKIEGEKKKYAECKRDLGFCIPGLQVHQLSTGKVLKMGKDYGKKLNKHTVKDALRLFLNAERPASASAPAPALCRELMLQLLGALWRVLHWFRSQRRFRIFASSLLLVYDARKLRRCVLGPRDASAPSTALRHSPSHSASASLNGTSSPGSPTGRAGAGVAAFELPSRSCSPGGGGGSLSPPSTPSTPSAQQPHDAVRFGDDSWHAAFEKIRRNHSFVNNYERELQWVRDAYAWRLGDLVSDDDGPWGGRDAWATVRMIDFAHVFPSSDDTPDANYLEGLQNLVEIFESLMEEAV